MAETETEESSLETIRPSEIINGPAWEKVLFTTYVLSLTFYETQLHRLGLARQNCRDIRIVSDADGYQMSLCERQSQRVGTEYRLTPAALPDGVFHPKIVWLGGKEFDLVLLGSGNLTFGGFGRNLECLDLIHSGRNPGCFRQLAEMLAAWKRRPDLKFAESEWMEAWIARANLLAGASDSEADPYPVILHSTIRSIGTQLAELVTGVGRVAEIRVLSPFYDRDASGILAFAASVGSPVLTVGLAPGQEGKSTFPFRHNRPVPIKIGAARFVAPKAGRTLHAKVIEMLMEDGSAFLLTGSVNATRKSLLTTDNIETAVLRRLSDREESPFIWEPVAVPGTFSIFDFGKAGLGGRVIVSGRLSSGGLLHGTLISTDDPSGSWNAELQRSDGMLANLTIEAETSGRFAVPLEMPEQFEYATGLQLRVHRGNREGTGWISIESLLSASRRNFLNPAVLLKLLGSEADEGDEAELLRYLVTSAQQHLMAFAPTRLQTHRNPPPQPSSDGDARIALDELETRGDRDDDAPGHSGHSEGQVLDGFVRRIRNNLLRLCHHQTQTSDVDDSGDDHAAAREQKENARNRKALGVSLKDFHEKLARLAEGLPGGRERSAALCMWLEVVFPILLRRGRPQDEKERFLHRWLYQTVTTQRMADSSDLLAGHVLAVSLALAASAINRHGSAKAAADTVSKISESLTSFCGVAVIRPLCDHAGIFDSDAKPLASGLLDSLPSPPTLSEALDAVESMPSPRQQLLMIIEGGMERAEETRSLAVVRIAAGALFHQRVAAGRAMKTKDLEPNREFCPACHLKLTLATKNQIRSDRFGICGNCNVFLIASH